MPSCLLRLFRGPWLLAGFLLLSYAVRAQTLTQAPVIGGSVSVPGTGLGAATDVNGQAQLVPAPAAGTRLRVEAFGYRPRLFTLPVGQLQLSMLLAPAAQAITEEVLVT